MLGSSSKFLISLILMTYRQWLSVKYILYQSFIYLVFRVYDGSTCQIKGCRHILETWY